MLFQLKKLIYFLCCVQIKFLQQKIVVVKIWRLISHYIKWLISTHQADFLMSHIKQQTNFGWSFFYCSDMFSIAVYRVGKAVCPHHIKIA